MCYRGCTHRGDGGGVVGGDWLNGWSPLLYCRMARLTSHPSKDPLLSTCSECEELLVHVPHTDHNYSKQIDSSNIFLKRKRCTDTANLIEPSSHLKLTIRKIEENIAPVIKMHWADGSLLKLLQEQIYSSGVLDTFTQTHHKNTDALKRIIAQKYVMCRIGAELRLRNRSIQEDGLRARRKMKCFTS